MATRERYVDVQLGNSICVKLPPVYQYDHGLQLRLSGLPTDSAIPQVHFSCVGTKEAFTVFPSIEEEIYVVEVPDVLLMQQNQLQCYVYTERLDSGVTIYELDIPIIPRARPKDISYTPEQEENYNRLLALANGQMDEAEGYVSAAGESASSAAGSAAAAAESASSAAESAEAAAESAREAEAAVHITIDPVPRAGSANPVSSGGVYNALATKQDALTFDNVPTANSTNPVKSGGVKAALNGKQDTLTFDNAPTANSNNPVKSGGVKEALDSKKDVQSAVSSPSASGNALAFIDTISQDAQGVITATKKDVTMDAVPTANSNNPVKSSGIKEDLDKKLNTIGKGINLLDNWYFIGGGSQQGGGQFPINQRGNTSYNNNVYAIDRWKLQDLAAGTSNSLTISNNGIAYRNIAYTSAFIQVLDAGIGKALLGKKVTLSLLYNDSLISCSGLFPDELPDSDTNIASVSYGGYWVNSVRLNTTGKIIIRIGQTPHGVTMTLKAAKLELGDTQTLAHQENGEWVLNDPPPDYGMELLKCQLSTADSSDTYANRAVAKADSIAIIVDGDTAKTAVTPGAYAYIKNNTHGLAEGLYKNKSSSAFPTSGGTADGTVFEAVSGGGLNILNNNKQDKLTLPLAVSQGGTGSTSLWQFLGHKTTFNYTGYNGTPNANDITYEDHIFAVNMPNTPGHGFLDVSYNNGAGFVPSGAKPIIRQIWTSYDNPSDVRVRIKMGDSAWTSWVRYGTIPITANMGTVTGTGSTVTVTKAVTGVTSGMTVDHIVFGTPSAVQSGWTVITATNSVTFSAVINGSTTVWIKLSATVEVTGT